MPSGLHLVSFASERFARARDGLIASALASRQFASVDVWDQRRLAEDESFPARHLLEYPRGVGFWSWQPHLILSTLERVPDGDAVLYYDAGRYRGGNTVNRSLKSLVAHARKHGGALPGVLIPQFGPNSRWTRRDCFVLMDCDDARFWDHPQVQPTFSLWVKNPMTLGFVTEWRSWCTDVRIVGDGPNTCGLPNLPGFVDHRHDQSVLTNLVIKHDVKPFVITSRLYNLLMRASKNSEAANVFCKEIDNVARIADGVSASRLYFQKLLAYKLRPSS